MSSQSQTRANSLESDFVDKEPSTKTEINSDERLTSLARKLSERSNMSPSFELGKGRAFDPQSPDFNARAWAKAFYRIRYNANDGSPPRVAGVAFNNLTVSGYGSPLDYQMSVGNAALKLPTLVHQWFGGKKQKLNILENVDGLLLPGEQLCVLGPPGSGCSTLLKTIAGETRGFEVDPA
jgi:ABC-type multidrug transport system fused ATPase/permease subunit